MNPKLTDEAVGSLRLPHGRAELMEEIVSTPVRDRTAAPSAASRARRTRWLVPLVAAATVAALATTPLWWGDGGSEPAGPTVLEQPRSGDARGDAEELYRVVLDAPGWTLDTSQIDERGAELTYRRGEQEVFVTWAAEETYEDYVFDREHITDPRSPGEPIVVLGRKARMWAYSATDHTMMRVPERGHWVEVRGRGMDRAAYERLLARLRLVDQGGLESTVSGDAGAVDDATRPAEVEEILAGIEAEIGAAAGTAGTVLPAGVDPAPITSEQVDAYAVGVEVTGAVACAWIGEFADAERAGDVARADAAAAVLATARRWPVLREMAQRGAYPDVVWGYVDQVAEGKVPVRYRDGLGCTG